MCTVSWLREPAGYQVFFNRDERRTRAPGLPPTHGRTGDTAWLAPLDGDHRGTWIGVSEHGVTLGLLNRYGESPADAEPDEPTSRGHLVTALLDLRALADLPARIEAAHPTRYRPFTLAAFAPDADACLLGWDGRAVTLDRVTGSGLVLTSSGHDQAGAARVRTALFARQRPGGGWTADGLTALHRSHEPERGPYSVCMHRPDAATVSATWVVVTPGAVRLRYHAGPPCRTAAAPDLTLPRRPGRPA